MARYESSGQKARSEPGPLGPKGGTENVITPFAVTELRQRRSHQQLYPGQVSISPHKYVDGHYLIVTPSAPADSTYRLVFETDGKLVTRFRSGKMPEVTWVEGCS